MPVSRLFRASKYPFDFSGLPYQVFIVDHLFLGITGFLWLHLLAHLSEGLPWSAIALVEIVHLFHSREGVASMTAIPLTLSGKQVRRCTCRVMLFDVPSSTDLAGRSGCYPLCATRHQLPLLCELWKSPLPFSWRIKPLSHHSGHVFAFMARTDIALNPTIDERVLLLRNLLGYIIQLTECLSLAGTRPTFEISDHHQLSLAAFQQVTRYLSICIPALVCETRTATLPFPIPDYVFGMS
jgi:hypothetical protein